MSTTPLRTYVERKGAAMRAAARGRPAGPDWRETIGATCVADDESGVRKVRIRDWQYVSDSGPDFGGANTGPSSPEYLCGVLGSCLVHTYLLAAAWLAIPVDRVEVTVTAENNDARFLDIATDDPPVPFAITARVKLRAAAASPADVARLHAYARERCPLTQLIRLPGAVSFVVED